MAKRHIRCKHCSSLATKRHGKYGKRNLQRFLCTDCGQTFSFRAEPNAQVTLHQKIALTKTHLEGRTSIRTIARDTGHSTKTVVAAIHEVTARCISAAWIATNLKPEWSGYLALDGKVIRVWDWSAKYFRYKKAERRWLHKMSLLLALDLGTLDLPTHLLGTDETKIDLVMLFQSLKAVGYPLKGYVSDGNEDISRAVEHVFGKGIPHQLCVTHFLRSLRRRYQLGELTQPVYEEARKQILKGKRPQTLEVPETLFTYQSVPQLPRTNQQMENCIRFLSLRLKTIGIFHSWQTATAYCATLVTMRRFTKFTDRKNSENGKAPLELAGCNITGLNYLELGVKNNTELLR